jgi:periplasmic divalent cation tolerance protein
MGEISLQEMLGCHTLTSMTEALVVLCSFPDREEARQIGTHLVEKQYAACINILPAMESIYRWEGELCYDEEFLLVMKTSRDAFHGLRCELSSLHPHDEPEIIALPVVDGSSGYLRWLMNNTR